MVFGYPFLQNFEKGMSGMRNQDMSLFQALEQMEALMRDLAPILYSYKKQLKKAGFTDAETMMLVIDLQQTLLTGGNKLG